jgi:hypothetical protein
MSPISDEEHRKRARALREAIASLRIEGFQMDDESQRIMQRHVDGEIGDEEFRAAIDELNEQRFGSLSLSGNQRS